MKQLALLLAFVLSTTLIVIEASPSSQGQSAKQARLEKQAAEKRQKDADHGARPTDRAAPGPEYNAAAGKRGGAAPDRTIPL